MFETGSAHRVYKIPIGLVSVSFSKIPYCINLIYEAKGRPTSLVAMDGTHPRTPLSAH